MHKVLGEWLGHFPVCGWLCVVCGSMQRITAKEGVVWDELVCEATRNKMIDVFRRLKSGDDPVKGTWLVAPNGKTVIWTDASNVALRVVLTSNDQIIKDAAWLREIE